jgi:hypothetical protein
MPSSPSFAAAADPAAVAAMRCSACPRAAFFQAHVESPAGHEFILRRANACASHLVDVIVQLRAWATGNDVSRGWLTLLAIDPYAIPRFAAMNVVDQGFAFYTAPIAEPIAVPFTRNVNETRCRHA